MLKTTWLRFFLWKKLLSYSLLFLIIIPNLSYLYSKYQFLYPHIISYVIAIPYIIMFFSSLNSKINHFQFINSLWNSLLLFLRNCNLRLITWFRYSLLLILCWSPLNVTKCCLLCFGVEIFCDTNTSFPLRGTLFSIFFQWYKTNVKYHCAH